VVEALKKITFRKTRDAWWLCFLCLLPALLLVAGCVALPGPKNPEGQNPSPDPPFPDVGVEVGIITDTDISVRGVKIGADGSQVLAVFGEPLGEGEKEVEESPHNPDYLVYWDRWVYDGIEFLFLSSGEKGKPVAAKPPRVYFICLTGKEFETDAGFAVGDPLTKVFERYGVQEIFAGETDSIVVYEDNDSLRMLVFFVRDDKVTRIELGIPLT
jgi:hypothetical protein